MTRRKPRETKPKTEPEAKPKRLPRGGDGLSVRKGRSKGRGAR